MKKHTIKRPIIKKFIIGSLSAGLLAGGAAPETDAIFVREVYAADSTESSEGETLAEPSVPAEPTAVPEPTAEPLRRSLLLHRNRPSLRKLKAAMRI